MNPNNNVPDPENPQEGQTNPNPDTQVNPGASNSADFQSSAPAKDLNRSNGDVSVETTSESPAATAQAQSNSQIDSMLFWGGTVLLIVLVCVYFLRKMGQPVALTASSASTTKAKPAKAADDKPATARKTKKKSAAKKKSSAKRKKTNKKKR